MNKIQEVARLMGGLIVAVLLVVPAFVIAADIKVTCDQGGCSISPSGTPLFDESNLVPDSTVTKDIEVVNDRDGACDLTLEATSGNTPEPSDFAEKLFTYIRDDSNDWYGSGTAGDAAANDKSLADLYGAGLVSLGTINSGDTRVYNWTVTFDVDANNDYQDAETRFDFDVNFSCVTPAVAGDTTEGDGDAEGKIAGVTAAKPGAPQVLGAAALADTGLFIDRLLRLGLYLGVIVMLLSLYGWRRSLSSRKTP